MQLFNNDCLNVLKNLESDSVDLIVTSPPYYNAREYSQYTSYEEYLSIMTDILKECVRVLKNQKYIIYNVSDIVYNNKKYTITSDFIQILKSLNLVYEDTYIWDKGEVQSKRGVTSKHLPYYFKPINCYETVLVFRKNELNKDKIRCPLCNSDKVRVNGLMHDGVYSFECGNKECRRTKTNRGFRFSERSILMQYNNDIMISDNVCKTFRRDILNINTVRKINSKGENILGHSAPYHLELVQGLVEIYSKENDLVLDHFLGSGTTAIACKRLNRHCVGIEINTEYFKLAKENVNDTK